VCGAPYKCPPAPSECALLLHDYLERKGVRGSCETNFVLPLATPVPIPFLRFEPRPFPLLYYHFICWLVPTVLAYCAFAGASGRTAATPSGLMLKAKKVKGSPLGFPH
jgi:hypothetical protein